MDKLGSPPNAESRHEASGFSLVELIIALGLFSFCIVSIIFLLSSGLSSSHDTQRDAAFGAILRSMDVELRSRSSSIAGVNDLTLYFNAAGGIVTNTSSQDVIFRAVVKRIAPASAAATAGITNTSKFSMWRVDIAYPSPTYNLTSSPYLIGNAVLE